jgi:hypothetical protein
MPAAPAGHPKAGSYAVLACWRERRTTHEPQQLLALAGSEAVGAPASVQVGTLDPLAHRGLGQVQLASDLPNRLAGAADQLDDLGLVLRRKEPAWSWHMDSHLEGGALMLGVHQTGSTPLIPLYTLELPDPTMWGYWGGRPPTFASPSASRSRHSRSAGRTTTTRPARPGAWTSLPASWPLRGRGHQPRGLPELLGEAGLSAQRLRTCKRSPTQTMRCKEPDPAPVGAAGRHRGRPARRPGCGHVPRRVRPPQPPAPRIGSGPPWPTPPHRRRATYQRPMGAMGRHLLAVDDLSRERLSDLPLHHLAKPKRPH